ncbi:MAG: hypothetical protein QUU85_01665 [Candidatus Eisenbacteria bacterium]|nr:hypothetical protein [Candidatus Eisenbacteria bacterium]
MIEIAEAFGRALGRAVRYEAIPWSLFRERRGSEMTAVYRWLNNVGYEVVLNEVRRQFPGLRTLEEFLLEQHHRERLGAGAA